MESTPINQCAAPMSACLEPSKYVKPILTPGYELRPYLIKLIQDQSFSGEGNENPYSHLWEFEQTYACLHIAIMSNKTLSGSCFRSLWQEELNNGVVKP
jgi:hypothetical protein